MLFKTIKIEIEQVMPMSEEHMDQSFIKFTALFSKKKEVILTYSSMLGGLTPLKVYPQKFLELQELCKRKPQTIDLKVAEFGGQKISYESFLFRALGNKYPETLKVSGQKGLLP